MSKSVSQKSSKTVEVKGIEGGKNHQLIEGDAFSSYNTKNMLFAEPMQEKVPNSTFVNKRVRIYTKNPDGSSGDLLLLTPRLFSFGVSENKMMNLPDAKADPNKKNGYTLPLCLWNKEGASPEEKSWTDNLARIVEQIKVYVKTNHRKLGFFDECPSLTKCDPVYRKRNKDDGSIVETSGPVLYAKLIESKKNNTISTVFQDPEGNPMDPMSILGKYCYVRAVIKIESLYITGSTKINLQVKVREVGDVELIESSIKPLFMKSKTKLSMPSTGKSLNDAEETNENTEKEGSIGESEEEDEETVTPMIKTESVKPIAPVLASTVEKPKVKPITKRVK